MIQWTCEVKIIRGDRTHYPIDNVGMKSVGATKHHGTVRVVSKQ